MKKNIFTTLIASIFIALCQTSFADSNEQLNTIVAVVNNGFITEDTLNDRISMIKHNLASDGTSLPPDDILRAQVLQQIIIQTLQLQMAKESGIHVSDEDVTKMIEDIAKQNNKTVQELYDSVTEKGDDYLLFRDEIRDELIIHRLQQREVASHIMVTPQEVDDYLRQHNDIASNQQEYDLENILISLHEAPTPEQVEKAKSMADQLLAEIKAGKDFRSLAVEHSNGEQALKGGDLGWHKLAELPSVFASEISTMKTGDVAGPIRTGNGFHLIKLTGMRKVAANDNTPAEQRIEIQNLLFQRKLNEHLQTWITQIRANAYIDIKDEKATQ